MTASLLTADPELGTSSAVFDQRSVITIDNSQQRRT
jgi:hypothetical protein